MFELVARSILDAVPLAIVASTPLLLAVEGELVVQRGGMINLGIEGMMLTAAMSAVLAAQLTKSVLFGFAGGIAGAAIVALLFGLFAIVLRADQIVTGTAINLFALGLTSFIYQELQGGAIFVQAVPQLRRDGIVPLAWIAVPIVLAILLWNTTFGLRLRAAGENPEAVAASVATLRWSALAIEALLAGLAGAHLASTGFAENMTAGRGFIALSIVIFGRWKVKGALLGTAVFGLAAALQYALQAASSGIPFHLLLALPYVVTLAILCGVAGRVRAPEALGKSS
jgi:simple sugar transport system permease protein